MGNPTPRLNLQYARQLLQSLESGGHGGEVLVEALRREIDAGHIESQTLYDLYQHYRREFLHACRQQALGRDDSDSLI